MADQSLSRAGVALSPHALAEFVPAAVIHEANSASELRPLLQQRLDAAVAAALSPRVIESLHVRIASRGDDVNKHAGVAASHKARGNRALSSYLRREKASGEWSRGACDDCSAMLFEAVHAYSVALYHSQDPKLDTVLFANRSACWERLAFHVRCASLCFVFFSRFPCVVCGDCVRPCALTCGW